MSETRKASPETIRCATCGEESGAAGSSMYGSVHKYGPVDHPFTPATVKPAPRIVAEYEDTCRTCGDAIYERMDAQAHLQDGHDVRGVAR